jgi:hypothetical protein
MVKKEWSKGRGRGLRAPMPGDRVHKIALTIQHGTFVWANKRRKDSRNTVGPCGTGRRAGWHRSAGRVAPIGGELLSKS